MTEPSSNVEVVLSSDLFNDDPCLESMSAPALAVLDAYMAGWGWLDSPTKKDCRGVAAALRAAADQAVCDMPDDNAYAAGFYAALGEVDAIATELENAQ